MDKKDVNMDKRVQFDFAVEFTNGGGIQGQGQSQAGSFAVAPGRNSNS
jgi:hypothetical protein